MKPGHCVTLIYTSGTTGPPKVRTVRCREGGWGLVRLLRVCFCDMEENGTEPTWMDGWMGKREA